jgi:hypothetical protein
MTSPVAVTATVKLMNPPDYPSDVPEIETKIGHAAFVHPRSDDHDVENHPSRLATGFSTPRPWESESHHRSMHAKIATGISQGALGFKDGCKCEALGCSGKMLLEASGPGIGRKSSSKRCKGEATRLVDLIGPGCLTQSDACF